MLLERQLINRGGVVLYSGMEETDSFCFTDKFEEFDDAKAGLFSRKKLVPVEVVKLHGSVNWFTAKAKESKAVCNMDAVDGDGKYVDEPPKREFNGGGTSQEYKFAIQHEIEGTRIAGEGVTPVIVPPLLGKTAMMATIVEQWKRAVDAVRHARQILILGYSFPPTDTFMDRLLAEGIRDNEHLHRLIIHSYRGNEAWRVRIRSMLSSTWEREAVQWIKGDFIEIAEALGYITSDSPEVQFKDMLDVSKRLENHRWADQ